VDSVWEQEKLEASLRPGGLGKGKMLGMAVESPASSNALLGVFYTEQH
jgi:hypothetical protein